MNALFHLDERILRLLRVMAILFSLVGIIGLTLIKYDVIGSIYYNDTAYFVVVVMLIAIGLIQYFWLPPTVAKHRFYLTSYHIISVITCIWITGFVTPLIIGWLMLIIATALSFAWSGVFWSSITLLGGVTLWRLLYPHEVDTNLYIYTIIESIFIILIGFVVTQLISVSQKRGRELNESRENERLQSQRLNALINSMGDAVVAVNEKGIIRIYNAAASNLLDTNDYLVGKSVDSVLNLRDGNHKKINIKSFLTELKGNIVRTDLLHEFSDKETIHLYVNLAPIHLGYQGLGERGYILILRDITKEKSLEQERDEFISVVSHELRTPIAIAEGSLSNAIFLQERDADKKVIIEATKDAYEQITFLAKMANDLSALSRAERGSEALEISELDIPAFIKEVEADYKDEAAKKGLKLITKTKGDLLPFPTSKLYVQEILQNFVTNAIKYTKEGSITITAYMQDKHLAISVKDTGIGISKTDQKHLFEKFFRSEDYRTRESNGTGLGLYLVQKLVEQLHADIRIESRLNHGSTFTLIVPPLRKRSHSKSK